MVFQAYGSATRMMEPEAEEERRPISMSTVVLAGMAAGAIRGVGWGMPARRGRGRACRWVEVR